VAELATLSGEGICFAHGHVLRMLGARWVGLDPSAGALLALATGSISELGHERETRVLWRWNEDVEGE
jgi:broad specificity phosphatase PhoE